MKEIVRLRPETIAGFACTWVPPGSLAVVAAYSRSTHGLLHGRASAPATRPSERESCGNAVLANVSYRATDGLSGSGSSWPTADEPHFFNEPRPLAHAPARLAH